MQSGLPMTCAQPLLTEPMTKAQVAKWFCCHRNQVDDRVLAEYPYEKDSSRIRMHLKDMPVDYHKKHGLI
jgi:hypothetical protein